MKPDPTLNQRYADILAEPANEDLATVVQALDTHFTVAALPSALSRAPRPSEHVTPIFVPKTTLHAMKGSTPMENRVTALEKRRRAQNDTPLTDNHSRRRSYQLIAAVMLVLMVGAYFGIQALHHQPGAGTPGSGATTTKTTPTPATRYLRFDAGKLPVTTPIGTSPITAILPASGDNAVSIQVHLDKTQTKAGDIVTAVWDVAGTPLTTAPLGDRWECCQHQVTKYEPFADAFNLDAALINPGEGSVTVSYNGKPAYKATFTVVAYTTPSYVPPTPTLPTPTK